MASRVQTDPDRRTAPVRLGVSADGPLDEVAHAARDLAGRPVADVLAQAAHLAALTPLPGTGQTGLRYAVLATVAAQDLVVARVLEPHVDALAILDEAGVPVPDGATWGVWAAEGATPRLEATPGPGDAWQLSGRKPWCSLAGEVSHALVTAWLPDGSRGLFAIDLADPGVTREATSWQPTGLRQVSTGTVAMVGVAARSVGAPGWYIDRPGFAWGGIGVAAIWYGGAVGVARRLAEQARIREPDQVALLHLGAVDAGLSAAFALLAHAARAADIGTGSEGVLTMARVRQVVADVAEDVLRRAGHALGPGPLALEPDHARRVADLALYLRQHHAERDTAALGRLAVDLDSRGAWW